MTKSKKIEVQGIEIVLYEDNSNDFISLTDIARHKDTSHTDDIIKNWLRNRNTIELLGFWEMIYNPDFKPVEFDGFRKQKRKQKNKKRCQKVILSSIRQKTAEPKSKHASKMKPFG